MNGYKGNFQHRPGLRLKIDGYITVARLQEAMARAVELMGEDFEGFYGANIYLQPYTSEGEVIALTDADDKPMVLSFGTPDGELKKPILTSAAKERIQARRDKNERIKAERQIAKLESIRERQRELDQARAAVLTERKARRAHVESMIEEVEEATNSLLKYNPEEIVAQINRVIKEVWDQAKPVYRAGAKMGEPITTPQFDYLSGQLIIHQGENGTVFRRVKNPLFNHDKKPDHPSSKLHLTHFGWPEAVNKILQIYQNHGYLTGKTLGDYLEKES